MFELVLIELRCRSSNLCRVKPSGYGTISKESSVL